MKIKNKYFLEKFGFPVSILYPYYSSAVLINFITNLKLMYYTLYTKGGTHTYLDLENWIRLLHQLCSAVVGNEFHDGTQFD